MPIFPLVMLCCIHRRLTSKVTCQPGPLTSVWAQLVRHWRETRRQKRHAQVCFPCFLFSRPMFGSPVRLPKSRYWAAFPSGHCTHSCSNHFLPFAHSGPVVMAALSFSYIVSLFMKGFLITLFECSICSSKDSFQSILLLFFRHSK